MCTGFGFFSGFTGCLHHTGRDWCFRTSDVRPLFIHLNLNLIFSNEFLQVSQSLLNANECEWLRKSVCSGASICHATSVIRTSTLYTLGSDFCLPLSRSTSWSWSWSLKGDPFRTTLGVAQGRTKGGGASFTPVQTLEETWCMTFPYIGPLYFVLPRTALAPFFSLTLDGSAKDGDELFSARRPMRTWWFPLWGAFSTSAFLSLQTGIGLATGWRVFDIQISFLSCKAYRYIHGQWFGNIVVEHLEKIQSEVASTPNCLNLTVPNTPNPNLRFTCKVFEKRVYLCCEWAFLLQKLTLACRDTLFNVRLILICWNSSETSLILLH